MREKLNAAVIGGGPAGSAAALLLARAGQDVTLLERRREAHDKVCGEFISWEAAHYLRRLGIDLEALGAQPVARLRLVDGKALREAALPFPAWSLSRRRLDEALLRQAEEAGARLRRGETVRTLVRQAEDWTLETAGREVLRADAVFLATGKHDLRDWPRGHGRGQERIGFKMHLRLAAGQREALRGHVEIHLYAGGYAGLEAIEEGKATLCLLVEREMYTALGKRWPALLDWLAAASPLLARRLAGAEPLWPRPLAVYGTPYGYLHEPQGEAKDQSHGEAKDQSHGRAKDQSHGRAKDQSHGRAKDQSHGEAQDQSHKEAPDLFRLGDQMAVIPSFAGDGIAIALHSAFLAVRACLAGEGAQDYHRQAREAFRRPLGNARVLEALLSGAAGRRTAFLLARLLPGLIPRAAQGTRLRGLLP